MSAHYPQIDPAIVDDPEQPDPSTTEQDREVPEEHELLLLMLELFRGATRTQTGDLLVPGGQALILQLRARILLSHTYPEFSPGHSE